MDSNNVASWLDALTLEEKAALCTGDTAWTTTPVDRVGLPSIRVADGPHGVRRIPNSSAMSFGAFNATCFPTAVSLAATWNVDLARAVGQAIGDEAIALGVDIVLGPGVNMKRSPLCGRNFEYFSEDPVLAGDLAAAWIDGVQGRGVGTSLKHFAVNNQETRRMTASAEVGERALREIYLPAFETAVRRSQPWTVMCAYNRINGTYGSEHEDLLTRILRDEWGFDGLVMSDWGAVHDRVAALEAGLELEMPGPRPRRSAALVEAVRASRLDEAVLDEAVRRILRVVALAQATPKDGKFDIDAHHALARRVAAEGIVLLHNDGILPLADGGTVAVIGRAAVEPRYQGGGSSQITPTRVDLPLGELAGVAPASRFTYAEGYPEDDAARPELIDEAVALASASDVALVFVSMPPFKETEGRDRSDLDLSAQQVRLIEAVCEAQPRTVVVVSSGSSVRMVPWADKAAAIVETYLAGQATGGAVADVLYGVVNPSGRLAETFPLALEDTPAYLNFPGEFDTVRYGEGIFIGYRWYEARKRPVQFPFGHGLSYTSFTYGPLDLSASGIGPIDNLVVRVPVTNTGDRAGSEVVQLYVHHRAPSVARPPKELKAFAKAHLEPGETRVVELSIDRRAFAYWNEQRHEWSVEPGVCDVLVGASSADIRSQAALEVIADPVEAVLTPMSPVEDWLIDPVGRPKAESLLRELETALRVVFGDDWPRGDGSEPVFHDYFLTMPLVDVVEFASVVGDVDPAALP